MQLTLNLIEPPPPRLADLAIGRNAAAMDAVRSLAQGIDQGHRSVLLWGAPGSGKSFWLHAWARQLADQAQLIDALSMAGEAKNDAQASKLEWVIEELRAGRPPKLVLIDHADSASAQVQEGLFQLYNAARESGWPMLLATSAAPMRLDVRDDLRTRMGQGLVFELHELNDNEKKEALRERARQLGLALPEEVLGYLITRLPRDLGLLTRVVDALNQHSLALHRAPTVPLLKDLLDAWDATARPF